MSRFLTGFNEPDLILTGFMIFLFLFIILVTTTLLKSQKSLFEYLETLPLEPKDQELARARKDSLT